MPPESRRSSVFHLPFLVDSIGWSRVRSGGVEGRGQWCIVTRYFNTRMGQNRRHLQRFLMLTVRVLFRL